MPVAAGVEEPGTSPLVDMAEAQKQQPSAPATIGTNVEVGVAPPSGSPIIDVLQSEGWKLGVLPAAAPPQTNTTTLPDGGAPDAAAVPDGSAAPATSAVKKARPQPSTAPAKTEARSKKKQ